MKIRKIYQGSVPENKVVSTYTESESNVYSCDYMNNLNASILTAYLNSNYSYSMSGNNTATKLPLNGKLSIGDKFTLSNNEIIIGNDVSIIKVSANISTAWNGTAQGDLLLYLYKNDILIGRVSGNKYDVNMSQGLALTPMLLNVSPGDRLSLALYTNNPGSMNIIGGSAPLATYMTVQTVEAKISTSRTKNSVQERVVFEGKLHSQQSLSLDLTPYKRLIISFAMYDAGTSTNTGGSSNIAMLELSDSPSYNWHKTNVMLPYIVSGTVQNVSTQCFVAEFGVNPEKTSFAFHAWFQGLLASTATQYYVSKIIGVY